jgi:mRNA interferase MazF
MVTRGEIWWIRGSKRCPVLVVQAHDFNESRIQTVICALINSDLRFGSAPGNVLVSEAESGLPREAVINVAQLVTIPRASLAERAGMVSDVQMANVDDGLRISLGL